MNKNIFLVTGILVVVLCSCRTSKLTSFTVASYNLRYENNTDSAQGNGWGQRYPFVAQLIGFHDFDIFGTQEATLDQLNDLKSMLPGYTYIGVGREDGKEKGEYSAIFYKMDRFELIEKGDFWLSETPEKPSVGWDAALPRICSWGRFKYKDSGLIFCFFNLHMDHMGKQARIESALLVQQKITTLGEGMPVVLTGDFNVDQTSRAYKIFAKSRVLKDTYECSTFCYALNGTFNNFNVNDFTTSRIDHIFVSPAFWVKKYGILTDTYRASYKDDKTGNLVWKARIPSDHFPVRVELEFTK